VWILDADLAAAFDRIDHDYLLAQLGTFPARDMVWQWLKAGVVERGVLTPTEQGTPQGGVISPVLLNVALHGIEAAAGVRHHLTGRHAGESMPDSPVVVRYADLCRARHNVGLCRLPGYAAWAVLLLVRPVSGIVHAA
jgi:RNA-directed DNA polymerase